MPAGNGSAGSRGAKPFDLPRKPREREFQGQCSRVSALHMFVLCMCARICVKGTDASDPIPRTPAEIRKATSARQKENHIQELTHQRKDVSGSTLAQRAEGTSALAQPYGPLTIPGMGRGAAGQCSLRLSRPFLLSPLSLPRRLLASAYYECPAFWSG